MENWINSMTILRTKLKDKMEKKEKNVKRGRRNRQRGAELQRQVVNLAKEFDLVAHNRDRGGAQHEMGDVEIEDKYFGCKRRKAIPRWVLPEKQEEGVFFRQDRGPLMVAVPADFLFFMMGMIKKSIQE
mgnify:FL=1|jgi:hypothetical protein|tara:strand:- start:945 stop:1331 length:387 start_codon:yes stop_codon:yes gene_type:complete